MYKITSVALLLLIGSNSLVQSAVIIENADDELIGVAVYFRHGDRTPKESFPTDEFFKMENFPMGLGQLTNATLSKFTAIASTTTFQSIGQFSVREYGKQAKIHADRKFLSDSESDSDLEWIGHRGETDFWRRKMRTFHGILDLNKDGVISFDDFKLLAERFVNLGNLTEQQVKDFHKLVTELWEKQWGEISPYNLVTVEMYLENMHHVLNDKSLVRRAHSFLPYLFKAVDKDKSGEITVEEFKLFFDVLGLQEQDAILAFRAIDSNGDGKISQKEFVKHGRDFFLTEDEDRISKYFWGPLVDH